MENDKGYFGLFVFLTEINFQFNIVIVELYLLCDSYLYSLSI